MKVQSLGVLTARGAYEIARTLHEGAQRTLVVAQARQEVAAQDVTQTAVIVKGAERNVDRAVVMQPHHQSARAGSMKRAGSNHPGQIDVVA